MRIATATLSNLVGNSATTRNSWIETQAFKLREIRVDSVVRICGTVN